MGEGTCGVREEKGGERERGREGLVEGAVITLGIEKERSVTA